VGRYENLAADFAVICQKLNIAASLPHLNRSHHRDYRAYYSERARKLVETHYQADIELFGYTFEGAAAGVLL
jgi:hypothetical protein